MTDNTYHMLLIFSNGLLFALLAVSVAFVVRYRRKYLMAKRENEKNEGFETEALQSDALEVVNPLIVARERFLDALRQKAKEGVEITNEDMRHIEFLQEAFRNEGMEHAVGMHKRTSRVSIAQTDLHLWGLADHEIAVLFNTTRQSVHNNWKRLLKDL